MLRDSIKRDLLKIFNIKRIVFDNFELGKEQEAIFVNMERIKNNYGAFGKKHHRVTGTVELCSSTLKEEWVAERISLANTGGFEFSTDLTTIDFSYNGNEFAKTSIRFEYRLSEEFNVDKTIINEIEWKTENV